MFSPKALLSALDDADVEFIVVGGVAANLHGSARLTGDLDILYGRSPENIRSVCAALSPLSPYPRGAPAGLPFKWDFLTLKEGLNFTLTTKYGDIDLLGEITGGGDYNALLENTIEDTIFGIKCRFLDLDTLIRVKRAAGRPKDFEVIAELEAIKDEEN